MRIHTGYNAHVLYDADLIISIDPGTTEMGWCVSAVGITSFERIEAGTLRLGAGHLGKRLTTARVFLVELLRKYSALHRNVWIALEDVGTGQRGGKTSKATTRALGASIGIIFQAAYETGIPAHKIVPINLSTAKKQATGNGSASKEEMVAAYEKATGAEALKADEADAYWIGYTLAAILQKTVKKPSTQAWKTISKAHAAEAEKARKAKARLAKKASKKR